MKKFVFIVVGLVTTGLFAYRPRHTVEHGRYKGYKLDCLWGVYPPDGDYVVRYGSDGTVEGEYTFYQGGRVVTSCHLQPCDNDGSCKDFPKD